MADKPSKSNKKQEALELVNSWKGDRSNITNAERLGRPPTKKELASQRWRAKNLASVKDNTVKPAGSDTDIAELSLRLLEAWNAYCSGMEQMNELAFKSFFRNSIDAGKRLRTVLRKQKKLVVILQKASLQYEHYLLAQRKLEKDKTTWDNDLGADENGRNLSDSSESGPKFVIAQETHR